jgi:hypothetical protein
MVESFGKGSGTMNLFELIPNNRPVENTENEPELWPELGGAFELNQYYRHFSRAEGWLGESYLIIWTKLEVLDYREPILAAYPKKYHFFASDGSGTKFGFFVEDGKAAFISAPNIGDEGDIRILGEWSDFLKSLQHGDYI